MLFISSGRQNLRRSDSSLAWRIPPLPKKLAASIECKPPPTKQAKKPAQAPAVDTHILDHMPLTVNLGDATYTYNLPFLRDNPDRANVYDVKCYRGLVDWDSSDPKPPKKKGTDAGAEKKGKAKSVLLS